MSQLFVVTSYKWSINKFTDPNPVYSHTYYVTILWNIVLLRARIYLRIVMIDVW
jgi:hypothetical protein